MKAFTTPTKRPRVRRRADQWRTLLRRFEQSGQTREQFCAEQGLALSSFSRWRGKMRRQTQDHAGVCEEAVFVALSSEEAGASGQSGWEVELQLGSDVVVRLRQTPC